MARMGHTPRQTLKSRDPIIYHSGSHFARRATTSLQRNGVNEGEIKRKLFEEQRLV